MKESIPFYVLRYLDQIPELHLQGLGRFYRVDTPAHIDLSRRMVLPPSRRNHLAREEKEDSLLFIRFLEYQSGKPGKSCHEAVRSFVNHVLLSLKKDGQVRVSHLGTFQSSPTSGIDFIADPESENARFLGFRAVQVGPLPGIGPESDVQDDAIAEGSPPLAEGGDPVREAEATETIAAQPALAASGSHRNAGGGEVAVPTAEAAAGMEAVAPEEIPENESRIQTAWTWYIGSIALLFILMALLFLYDRVPEQLLSLTTEQAVSAEQGPPGKQPVMEGSVDTQFAQGISTRDHDATGTPDDEKPPENRAGADLPISDEKPPEEGIQAEAVAGEKDPYAQADCMVVVGAFKEPGNVVRMETRLRTLGYRPYVRSRGSLSLVGVKRPCRTPALRNVLFHTRSEIAGGAWVLRIAGTPPSEN